MKWEYKTAPLKTTGWIKSEMDMAEIDSKLNEFGSEGWELTGVAPLAGEGGKTTEVVFLFKRPCQ